MFYFQRLKRVLGILVCSLIIIVNVHAQDDFCKDTNEALVASVVTNVIAPQDSDTDNVDADEKIKAYIVVLDANIAYLDGMAGHYYDLYLHYVSIGDPTNALNAWELYDSFRREKDYLLAERLHWIQFKAAIEDVRNATTVFNGGVTFADYDGSFSSLTAFRQTGCMINGPVSPVWDTMPAESKEHLFMTAPKFGDTPVLFFRYNTKTAATDTTAFVSFRNYFYYSPYDLDPVTGAQPDDIIIEIDGLPWIESVNGSLAGIAENNNAFTFGESHNVVVKLRSWVIDGNNYPSWSHDTTMDMTLFSFNVTFYKAYLIDAMNFGPCVECLNCPTAGNPINMSTGNKFETETDFFFSGPGLPMKYTRYYNSRNETEGYQGYGWTGSFSESVKQENGIIILTQADARKVLFTDSGDSIHFISQTDEMRKVEIFTDGYVLTEPNGKKLFFDTDGKLIRIDDRNGNTQTITYADDRLAGVQDGFGRQIGFSYNTDGHLDTLTTSIGVFLYTYDTNGNLTRATKPDGTFREYRYEDPADSHNLTGIVNENGIAYVTFTYDGRNRGISSEFIGNTDKIQIDYTSDFTREVTDSNNNTRFFSLDTKYLTGRVKSSSGSGCDTCPSSLGTDFVYNDRFQAESVTDPKGGVTFYTYDDRGNILTATQAQGTPEERTTAFTWHTDYNLPLTVTRPSAFGGKVTDEYIYDTNGNLRILKKNKNTALERITTFTWDDAGRITGIDGPRTDFTDTVTFTYYPNASGGHLMSISNGMNHKTLFSNYNAFGKPGRVIDPNNVITDIGYDDMGRIVSKTVAGVGIGYSYDNAGNLKGITLPGSRKILYDYTDAGRLEKITDNSGNYILYSYDSEGNRAEKKVHDSSGTLRRWTNYEYDEHNRLERILYPGTGNPDEYFGYDVNNNLTSFTDGNGKIFSYAYDALQRMTSETALGNIVTVSNYDSADNLKKITDARSNAVLYTYDDLGNMLSADSPDSGSTGYGYDKSENMISRTDANNITVTYDYDALSRLTDIHFPDSSQDISYGYDSGTYGNGKLTSVTDPAGDTSFTYNALGRLVKEARTAGGLTFETVYEYDPITADLSILTYPSGTILTFQRDNNGRISGISVDGQSIVGGMAYLPFGPVGEMTMGSLSLVRNFDQRYQVSGIDAGTVMNRAYTYDGAGNVKSISGMPKMPVASGTTNYTLPTDSNLLSESIGQTAKTYTYDPAGNIVFDGVRIFIYNQNNRLIQVSTGPTITSEYAYDGFGRRVKKTVGSVATRFHYDVDGNLISETDGNGLSIRDYIYLYGEPVAMKLYGNQAGIYYFINDHLGTPQKVTDASGTVVWEAGYLPFGEARILVSGIENNLRFPGQYYDAETGLHYNWHRYYNPGTGKFLTSDPIGLDGGINPFVYSDNNPINLIDPFGLMTAGKAIRWGGTFWGGASATDGPFVAGEIIGGVVFFGSAIYAGYLIATMGDTDKNASGSPSISAGGACPNGDEDPDDPKLKPLHSEKSFKQSSLDHWRSKSTNKIVKSLKRPGPEKLKIRPDGTVLQGNHRVKVLLERGFNTSKLYKNATIVPKTPSLAPWE